MNIILMLTDVSIAYIFDLIFGDPYWFPHPVRFIGWMIKALEKVLRKFIQNPDERKETRRNSREFTAGLILAIIVPVSLFLIVFLILKSALLLNPVLYHLLNIYFIYSALAAKCLANESLKVYHALKSGDVNLARKQLSMLVGRQTEDLDEHEIIRGVVETTAENTVDGVISPLLYALAGSLAGLGAPLVYAFKAISTLDSMVGYMNKKYLYFGRASAKIDDAANFIPARLAGLLIPIGAFICGKDIRKSFRIMLRDRRNHKSPNCAYPEAAVAGALGVRLGGTNIYFGQALEKPTIGDAERKLEIRDIPDTVRIMYASSVLTLIIGLVLVYIIYTG